RKGSFPYSETRGQAIAAALVRREVADDEDSLAGVACRGGERSIAGGGHGDDRPLVGRRVDPDQLGAEIHAGPGRDYDLERLAGRDGGEVDDVCAEVLRFGDLAGGEIERIGLHFDGVGDRVL